MPTSKFDEHLTFDEKEWVVSLLQTNTGPSKTSKVFGGHARIVVEGLKRKEAGTSQNFFSTQSELFIGDYQIVEVREKEDTTWIPQVLRNTQCKYNVIVKEESEYTAYKIQQYSEAQARSVGGIYPQEAMKMIEAIKQEKENIINGLQEAHFQYAGKSCFYGKDNAHNCTTWAEGKLDIIGIGKHLLTDSVKAAPSSHAYSGQLSCTIL